MDYFELTDIHFWQSTNETPNRIVPAKSKGSHFCVHFSHMQLERFMPTSCKQRQNNRRKEHLFQQVQSANPIIIGWLPLTKASEQKGVFSISDQREPQVLLKIWTSPWFGLVQTLGRDPWHNGWNQTTPKPLHDRRKQMCLKSDSLMRSDNAWTWHKSRAKRNIVFSSSELIGPKARRSHSREGWEQNSPSGKALRRAVEQAWLQAAVLEDEKMMWKVGLTVADVFTGTRVVHII